MRGEDRDRINGLTETIIGAAIEVHRELGPGLLESASEQCLCHELSLRSVGFQRQVPLPVSYKSILLDCGYRIDILVEDLVIVELKTVEKLLPLDEAQLLTYLKLLKASVGLLINFQVRCLKTALSALQTRSFLSMPPCLCG
jgi:GxxExxY protein